MSIIVQTHMYIRSETQDSHTAVHFLLLSPSQSYPLDLFTNNDVNLFLRIRPHVK
jgi:hypothetical protein